MKNLLAQYTARKRPTAVRIKRIFDLLKQNRFPDCAKVAAELEVSEKTVRRDLKTMRDQMGLPIEYFQGEHGFAFTEQVHEFPTIQVFQGELLALLVAQKAIEQYRGPPRHHQLETAFAKILAPLSDMTGYAPTDDAVSFKITAPVVHKLDTFDRLGRVIGDCLEVTFDYRKPGETSRRSPTAALSSPSKSPTPSKSNASSSKGSVSPKPSPPELRDRVAAAGQALKQAHG